MSSVLFDAIVSRKSVRVEDGLSSLHNQASYIDQCSIDISQSLRQGRHVAIQPDHRFQEKSRLDRLLAKYSLDFRELGLTISDFLGKLTTELLKTSLLSDLTPDWRRHERWSLSRSRH